MEETESENFNFSFVLFDDGSERTEIMTMFKDAGIEEEDVEPTVVDTILEMRDEFELTVINQACVMTSHADRTRITIEDVKLALNMNQHRNHLNLASRDVIDYHKRIDTKTMLFKPYLDMRKNIPSAQGPDYEVQPEFYDTPFQNNFNVDEFGYQESDIETIQDDLRHRVQLQSEAKPNTIRPVIIQPKQVMPKARPKFKIIAQPNTNQ